MWGAYHPGRIRHHSEGQRGTQRLIEVWPRLDPVEHLLHLPRETHRPYVIQLEECLSDSSRSITGLFYYYY
jgi:hypothetical protein